jgi:hypothetical protein
MKTWYLAAVSVFIFSNVNAEDVEVIWSKTDAPQKCPETCRAKNLEWSGESTTTAEGKVLVCDCKEAQPEASSKMLDLNPIARHCHMLGLKKFAPDGTPIEVKPVREPRGFASMANPASFKDRCLAQGYREKPETEMPQSADQQ